jgi:hypothetical protein
LLNNLKFDYSIMQRMAANIRKLNLFETLVISLFWLLLFASPLLQGITGGGIDWNNVLKLWKEHFVLLTLFLLNRFVLLPFLFFRHKRIIYVFTAVLSITIAVAGIYMYDKKPPKAPVNTEDPAREEPSRRRPDQPPRRERRPGNVDKPNQPEPIPAYINMLILSVLVIGFDTGLKTASKWIRLEQKRIILEKDNVETQLAFLKHQISPHFFMNTLNNIHSLIDIDKIEAKKAVIKLSNLMRHLLYESGNELSPLNSEVDFIRSYVDLMKIRFSENVNIELKLPSEIPDKSIPPLIFVSLLENAFKHGISYISPSFINIELSFDQSELHFRIINSRHREVPKTRPSGIGIENTRKRLELLYREKYKLETSDKGNMFVTDLTIPI